METLEFVKSEIIKNAEAFVLKKGGVIEKFDFESTENILISFKNNVLHFDFDGGYYYYQNKTGKQVKRTLGVQFTCSYKTKSGYISTKKLPVSIKDFNNVTLEEAAKILEFRTDAVQNTFDPFYYENKARRASNHAWNQIAKGLTDSTWG
jgi:hypothetical protein